MCGICFVCILSQLDKDGSTLDHNIPCHRDSSGATIPGSGSQHEDKIGTLLSNPLLHSRGPDVSSSHVFPLGGDLTGYMQGCVLHLRGQLTPQPVKDMKGNAFLWNGEVFDGIQVADHENDTSVLFSHLVRSSTEEDILTTMQKVHGPWSFIFWQADAQKLWFGRDMFGRRSFLWHLPDSGDELLVLSSVAFGDMSFAEIPAVGIFSLDFSGTCKQPLLTLFPWPTCRWPGTSKTVTSTEQTDIFQYMYPNHSSCIPVHIDKRAILNFWIPVVGHGFPETNEHMLPYDLEASDSDLKDLLLQILKTRKDLDVLADNLISVLQRAVERRVNCLPGYGSVTQDSLCSIKDLALDDQKFPVPGFVGDISQVSICESRDLPLQANVAVLFSGGLDSTILAALADRCVPAGESIDLLNVAFEQPSKESLHKKEHKQKTKKQRRNFRKVREESSESSESGNNTSDCGKMEHDSCANNRQQWEHGVSGSFSEFRDTSQEVIIDKSSTTGKLTLSPDFCADVICPDVAEYPQTAVTGCTDFSKNTMLNISSLDLFSVPDRETGRIALSELNPRRRWNFVEINVTQSELKTLRQSHIRKLIYPSQTVLDDSIGCAVWFAARGHGVLPRDGNQKYVSRAKVILCGMAADEQFAGYSRHRVTFKTKGWEGLVNDIQEEMWRISARNLGRDDRIIADHGKEARFPFLDETFTKFVSSIPVHKRADLRLPRGVGEKLLLRLCALKLGLVKTAVQPKRAIQFGSKIAKLDNRKEKGSDICARLT